MQSPAAQIVGLAVRRYSSTTTMPRSVTSTPSASRPMSPACERRPTDTSSFSAEISVPSSSFTVTPSSRYSETSDTWRPRWTVDALLLHQALELGRRAPVDARRAGAGRISTTVILRPSGGEQAGELAADHPAAHHDHALGHRLEHQDVVGGHHRRVVHVEARQPRGLGADAHDQVVEGVALVADHHRAASTRPSPRTTSTPLRLAAPSTPWRILSTIVVLALHHAREVERDLGHDEAEVRRRAGPAAAGRPSPGAPSWGCSPS